MIKGFREFIMRGNVIDLAVAFVIGVAFAAVVKALLDGLINPLVAAIFGKPNLDSVGTFTINGADFSIGLVLTALINFLIIAVVIYFIVVVPMNALAARRAAKEEPTPDVKSEVDLLQEIADELRAQRGSSGPTG
ncbi:MAG TPA: large conductance mechanosensitive channel protein MscL [Actinomycetes bacterium]